MLYQTVSCALIKASCLPQAASLLLRLGEAGRGRLGIAVEIQLPQGADSTALGVVAAPSY